MATCDFNRDCLKVPFPKACFDFCMHKILEKITPEQKVEILGLSPTTAQATFYAFNNFRISSFVDLQQYLTIEQIDEISQKFKTLTQGELNQLMNKGKI